MLPRRAVLLRASLHPLRALSIPAALAASSLPMSPMATLRPLTAAATRIVVSPVVGILIVVVIVVDIAAVSLGAVLPLHVVLALPRRSPPGCERRRRRFVVPVRGGVVVSACVVPRRRYARGRVLASRGRRVSA